MKQRTRVALITYTIFAIWIAATVSACAGNKVPAGTPKQVAIAHYAADVLSVVEKTQTDFIALNRAGSLSDDVTRKILDAIKKVNDVAGRLASALREYDALDVAARGAKLSDLSVLVAEFGTAASGVFHIPLPPGVVAQASALAANINKTIMNVQLALAGGQ